MEPVRRQREESRKNRTRAAEGEVSQRAVQDNVLRKDAGAGATAANDRMREEPRRNPDIADPLGGTSSGGSTLAGSAERASVVVIDVNPAQDRDHLVLARDGND